jgi:thiamine biosynthesis lipoprotein
MKQTELIMGMPVTVEIAGGKDAASAISDTFAYFKEVDERYSTYKTTSEISRINEGLPEDQWSDEMKLVLSLCEETKQATHGFFDITRDGKCDPSGLVKGWAIEQAAERLRGRGLKDFCLEAGGDFQVSGVSAGGRPWKIGIRNPFNREEIIKVLTVSNEGVATSGTAIRGQHIYNPHAPAAPIEDIKSLTVIGPNIYEADRFATAAFAMGKEGIGFIESLPGFEAYMIDAGKTATFTSGFERYIE